jgi:hypothetical protein
MERKSDGLIVSCVRYVLDAGNGPANEWAAKGAYNVRCCSPKSFLNL